MPQTPYERESNFDLCTQANSTSDLNIYIADIIDLENIHYYEWVWIFPLLHVLQLFLYVLEDKGKIHIFGPSVTVGELVVGKRQLPNTEPQENSNPEEIQGILFKTLTFVNK